jgi:hypothetical protein
MVVATVDPGDYRQHALEPFNGTGVISAALRAAGVAQACTNDLASSRPADLHEDALQPCFYRSMTPSHLRTKYDAVGTVTPLSRTSGNRVRTIDCRSLCG